MKILEHSFFQASVYPEFQYYGPKTPYFSNDIKTVRLFQPATPYMHTLSELIIENIEQPLKCDAEFTVTIKYYFIGETVEDFKSDIVYMVRTCAVLYILTVMAPLFVNSINWLHWSIYHRSVICLFQVLSKGVIVHHGYEKVEVKSSNGAASGTVLFKLSVGADLAPAVQILAYCVLPSENIVARSTTFDIEKCFKNKECKTISKKHICPFTLIMVILVQY